MTGGILAQDTQSWLPVPYRRSAFECLDSQYDDCRGCYGSLRTWAAFAAHYLGAERLVLCAMTARAGLSTIACLAPSCGLSRAIRPPAHRKAMAAKVPSLCFRLTVSRMSSEAHRSCRQPTAPPHPPPPAMRMPAIRHDCSRARLSSLNDADNSRPRARQLKAPGTLYEHYILYTICLYGNLRALDELFVGVERAAV